MPQIRIDTHHTHEVAQRLLAEADRLSEIGHELQNAIGGLDTWAWDGRSRSRAEPLLARVRPESEWVKHQLEELGYKLVRVANIFEQKDNSAAGKLAALPWVDFEAVKGSVLGVATVAGAVTPAIVLTSLPLTGESAPNVSDMKTWKERLDYAKELPGQIKGLEGEQKRLEDDIVQDDKDIADLGQQIKELEAKRDALKEEAGDFWNKVKRDPDGWRWGFDDGIIDAPWRTKSDALEDEIAKYDSQIQELQAQKDALGLQRLGHEQSLNDANKQLDALRQSQTELNRVIENGIPSSSTPSGKRAGCVLYVSKYRDISDFNGTGTPSKWDTRAAERNYETGAYPVKGALMVYDGDVLPKKNGYATWKQADGKESYVSTAGHVEYVTDVRCVEKDGRTLYEVDVAGASTEYNEAGEVSWNKYVDEYNTTYLVDPQEIPDGVWFLYDKAQSPGNVSAV
ncbi:MAG: hypothetical protein DRI37_06715 [Chloroflexi bacterium]|nr:MAG: hypothetical protein DRI37_06715 [Chloroflexota bacterium]